jgi:hypothetical protein
MFLGCDTSASKLVATKIGASSNNMVPDSGELYWIPTYPLVRIEQCRPSLKQVPESLVNQNKESTSRSLFEAILVALLEQSS